jgi:Alkylmercury lyase
MPQNVPEFEFSDNAKQVRAFVFEFWCEQGRGPTLLEVHQSTNLDRRRIIAAYKELQLGIDVVVNEDTQNCNLLKAPPFSSFPSQVRAYIDDPFKDKTVRLESHCACCFTPVTLISKNFEMQSVTPPGVFLHISLSPYDWNNVDMSRMCDSMNYVLDAEHAERYEKQTATRGILVDLDQAKMFVQNVANERMYNFHWKPGTLNPRAVIKGFQMMGVDTSAWE